jgi:hypothetical protein
VGLYLNPPDRALVLSVDEKSQIQALDRTAPILPGRPGLPEPQTHDHKRLGTTPLFAAFNILNGKVLGRCLPRHRGREFARFLGELERAIYPGLANWNEKPQPFVGKATAAVILDKVRRCKELNGTAP